MKEASDQGVLAPCKWQIFLPTACFGFGIPFEQLRQMFLLLVQFAGLNPMPSMMPLRLQLHQLR